MGTTGVFAYTIRSSYNYLMDQPRSRNFYFALFASLYFVQGVITSYQLNFFKPHMTSAGIDADRIGVVASLALLPFVLKFVYGIVSDRVNLFGLGHRWPYMMIGVIACALAFAIMYFIDPATNYGAVAVIVIFATFFMAMFDAGADAYAIDVTDPADQDRVQSYMTGGRAVGLVILSMVFGFVAERFGYSAIFPIIAICLLFPLILLWRVREPKQRKAGEEFQWSAFRVILRGNNLLFALLLIGTWFAFQGIDGLVTLYMSDELGANEIMLGNYGSLKGIGMIGGAILATWGVAKFGRKNLIALTITLISVGGLILGNITQAGILLALGILWGVVAGLHWTVYLAVAMAISDRRIASSMFTLFGTMLNIGIGLGDGIPVSLTDNMSYTSVFQLLALGNLVFIPFAWWLIGRMNIPTDTLQTAP